MNSRRPVFRHPNLPKNDLGYTRRDYEGLDSTLCAGCGHDSISNAIIQACFELSIAPHQVVKLSGIGCSSKTPAYFLNKSHGFNTVHGRMPAIATGANMANKDLLFIGVSGDGDTASIGMGQFVHLIRRNLNMVYIVMNNGCYGLTKGQDSATADRGSSSRKGRPNPFEAIDLCATAVQMGAGFVARGFSGDKEQLVPLLKAGIRHKGFALVDVISPCVTFNNTPASTKSYHWVRDHMEATATVDFIPEKEEITASCEQGKTQSVTLHDGTLIHLHKTDAAFDVTNRRTAINEIEDHREQGRIPTGILHINQSLKETHEILETTDKPLNTLTQKELCPGNQKLQQIFETYR
ncbi:MAG: 2-oxoacid:ferredoxin oxidoreductase subunit beta [Desulfobacter sp.]|nr:2-oxoacid:ferredoxin oxidoreductase subunit beta [Desulfobacter sp.]WDP86059.1 MAG: 2-oxoacid:ferredoxin oxidoreductase subunit beta [Desulfobacter sp.]